MTMFVPVGGGPILAYSLTAVILWFHALAASDVASLEADPEGTGNYSIWKKSFVRGVHTAPHVRTPMHHRMMPIRHPPPRIMFHRLPFECWAISSHSRRPAREPIQPATPLPLPDVGWASRGDALGCALEAWCAPLALNFFPSVCTSTIHTHVRKIP